MDVTAVIAASVVGVLAVLLTLAKLYAAADSRYVTRREYDAILGALRQQLEEIKLELRSWRH